MAGDKTRSSIKWTETARLQLVEAVIAVEEEMRKNSIELNHRSAEKGGAKWTTADKWDAISNLLPLELRGKTWNCNKEMFNIPKCRTFFYNLLKAYRDRVGEKIPKNAWTLTEPVLRILKKREDLANATCSVQAKAFRSQSGSSSSNSVNDCKTSPHDAQQKEESGLNGEGNSLSSVREEEAAWSLQYKDDLQSTEDFDINVEREESDHVDRENSMEKARERRTTRPSRSANEFKHAEKKLLVQNGAQTRSETRSQTADGTQDSLRKRKDKPESTHLARYDQEDLNEIMEKPQKRLDLELSHMNCWFQNRVIPLGKSIFSEIISSEIRSGKKPRLSVHQSHSERKQFDQLVQKEVGRLIDNEMQASFHKLRARLVKELKNMSVNLAQKILEDADSLNSGPTSNHGGSRKRFPLQEMPASPPREWNRPTRCHS